MVSKEEEKDKECFPSLSHIKCFFFSFFFKPRADDYTAKQLTLNSVLRIIQQQWILLKDTFLLLENLLIDPVILKCIW